MASKLVLGKVPGKMELRYVTDDSWSDGIIYKVDGVPEPWPATPILEFLSATVPDVVAVLSEGDSRADWSMTEDQVDALTVSRDRRVRLVVDGSTWFAGEAVAHG